MTSPKFIETLRSLFVAESLESESPREIQTLVKKSSNGVYVKIQPNRLGLQLDKDRKERKEWTDVQLKIGDKLFHAHRVVLSGHSPVLEAMICKKWLKDIYPISDEYVDVEIVEDLLSFFYTGNIKLTPDNVFSVCMAAHFLQISTILEPGVKYLCKLIDMENVFKLFEFSTTFELRALNFACLKFVKLNRKILFNDQATLELPIKVFVDLIVGLKNHFFDAVFRENTFRCIVLWDARDLLDRSKYLQILLDNLSLHQLSFNFTEKYFKHPLAEPSLSGLQASDKVQLHSRPPKTRQNMIVLGGTKKIHSKWGDGDRFEKSQTMSCYDSSSGVWSKLPDMPPNCLGSGAIVVNQQDIIVRSRKNTTRSIHMFDWISQTWAKLPKMPYSLTNILMAELNGDLFVAGIRKCEELSNKTSWFYRRRFVEIIDRPALLCYSFETKQWKRVEPMNTIPKKSFLVSCKNHLYALHRHNKDIEKYDPVKNQWSIVASMRKTLAFAATSHQDKIYVGGLYGIEVFDPDTNACTVLSAAEVELGTSLVSMNEKLMTVGGQSYYFPEKISDSIREYDFLTHRWNECGRMISTMIYHSTLVGAFY